MTDFKEAFCAIGGILLAAALVLGGVLFCIAWCDGHAKSAFLKEHKGVDAPWYQATFVGIGHYPNLKNAQEKQ